MAGCGKFVQKTEGCDIMMCGTNAHGRVKDAIRNGGCACIFDWNSLKPCTDGHGYHNEHNTWVKTTNGEPGKPANERQVLFKKN